MSTVPVFASPLYSGSGRDGIGYKLSESDGGMVLEAEGGGLATSTLFVALGQTGQTGSRIVPFGRDEEGSTVFLPFNAQTILMISPERTAQRRWTGTMWNDRQPAPTEVRVERSSSGIRVALPPAVVGPLDRLRLAVYVKDFAGTNGWGRLFGNIDPAGAGGTGDIVLRRYLAQSSEGFDLRGTGESARPRIYQFLPRHFGNTNETRKVNGSIEENGSGKFSDMNERSLAELKKMGFTHVWPTGVLQQATATDYSEIGEPADDPDLLKGLAGSPYAIRDYFDVCPDYADNPAERLAEFRAMVDRIHAAGLKVIIDFVPNHVARSYRSSIRPDLSFGENDDKTRYFDPKNNFFWLTPEARPFGKGPPLRLPTVDSEGRPASPTAKVAKTPSDGLFAPEMEHGRVTGSNLASWEPDMGSWYETVKLNYGYDFLDPTKSTRLYPHGANPDIAVPDTWTKMDEIIAYWQGLGVDGFRVDMAHMVPPEFWHWMIARARGRNPDVFFVAEAYDTDPGKVPSGDPLVAEVGGGNVMFDLLNAGFDAVYDDATYDKLKEIYDKGAWANDLDRIAARPFVADNSLRYAENHDEVRLAAKGEWGNVGPHVGRPVSAILYGLSRGPVMLYSGQEVGEPAAGEEGFGGDDARTSIFDYWSMPEFTKWVNNGAFDGGRLSPEQRDLREFYGTLLRLVAEPAFRDGDFFPMNPENEQNPDYGRLPGESASGHWLYSYVRRDPTSGQTFLIVVNLHPSETFQDVRVRLPAVLLDQLGKGDSWRLSDRLGSGREIRTTAADAGDRGIPIGSIGPLTPLYLEMIQTKNP
ncbi:MAG: alpha-amylase family glycosyl hydrolase [Terrimicrobiaceae bacterium]|nr:alpha-amylase family glycosyl hydrolase [Terrimicrobiaceae bacterium]